MTHPQEHAELIAIVDESDNIIGSEKRKIAREKGLIHRIVRIIIMNHEGQILVQQRAATLPDNPLKWDWSATGHVDSGEDYLEAALRETAEEIGITDANLKFIGTYYSELQSGDRIVRRFNGVYSGQTKQVPHHDPGEVNDVKWVTPAELTSWLETKPGDFSQAVSKVIGLYGAEIFPPTR